MAKTSIVEPVSLISGLIYGDFAVCDLALAALEDKFGPVQFESESFPFTHTDYYAEEMGAPLTRKFIAFERLVGPDTLKEAKEYTIRLEHKYLHATGGRQVNLDPGTVGLANVVLVSTKDFAHRVYLGDGIFGEVTMIYSQKTYQPLPWTYPDYREPAVIEFLLRVRENLKEEIIALRQKR